MTTFSREPLDNYEDNVTKLPVDRRPVIVHWLKQLTLLGLMVTIIVSAVVFREDLNAANIRRMLSYLHTVSMNRDDPVTRFSLDSSMQNQYTSIGGGLAVINRDTLSYINMAGVKDMEVQLGYARPAVTSGNELILAYDRGAQAYSVSTTFKTLVQDQLSSPIITAYMNPGGDFAICTDERGYRAAITVYDDRQKPSFQWQTSEYFINEVTLSDNGRHVAAAAFNGTGIAFNSHAVVFATNEKEPLCDITFPEQSILGISFLGEKRICIVTELQTAFYSLDGSLIASYPYASNTLKGFSLSGGSVFLAIDTGRSDDGLRLVSLNENAEEISHVVLEGELQSIDNDSDRVAVLTSRYAALFARDLKPVIEPREIRGASRILLGNNSSAFVIYADHADLIGLE